MRQQEFCSATVETATTTTSTFSKISMEENLSATKSPAASDFSFNMLHMNNLSTADFDSFNFGRTTGSVTLTTAATSSSNSVNLTVSQENLEFHDTRETLSDYQASLTVWRYCPMVLLPVGTVGNLMTIGVLSFTRVGGTSAIPLFFRALAVSDLLLLYSGLLRNWIKYYFYFEIRETHSVVCKVHIWLVYVTGMTSAWFLVAMTSQRSLSVVWPHRLKLVCTKKTALVMIVVIVVVASLINAHNLYGYDLIYYEGDQKFYCDYLNEEYESFARGIWPWIDMTLSSLLPFILLIINNSLLMWKVASSVRTVMKLTGSRGGDVAAVSQRKRMSTSINLTLICLSAMFLLLTSPVLVFLIVENFVRDDLLRQAELSARMELAWAVTNSLWYANSTVNFYVYFLSGASFRQRVVQCLCCLTQGPRRHNTNGSMSIRSLSGSVVARQNPVPPVPPVNVVDETTEF